MKKEDLVKDLMMKAAQVLKIFDPVALNTDVNGKKAMEYSYTVRFPLNDYILSEERDVSIVVFDEGLQTEKAFYNHGVLPDGKSDIETMVMLSKDIDPKMVVIDSPAPGVWKVRLSTGSLKLVALNSSRNGFVDVTTE